MVRAERYTYRPWPVPKTSAIFHIIWSSCNKQERISVRLTKLLSSSPATRVCWAISNSCNLAVSRVSETLFLWNIHSTKSNVHVGTCIWQYQKISAIHTGYTYSCLYKLLRHAGSTNCQANMQICWFLCVQTRNSWNLVLQHKRSSHQWRRV